MYKAIVFAGTTEGYEICRFLSANKISALACVATEYGSHSLEAGDYLRDFICCIFYVKNRPILGRCEDRQCTRKKLQSYFTDPFL